MSRPKKGLTRQSQWTLILVGGLCFIYVGTQWNNFFPTENHAGTIGSVLTQANSDILAIPSLNITAPIVYSEGIRESSVQRELQNGVVHLAATALPGDSGNAYIVGHSSNFDNAPGVYNEIFKELTKIRIGDEVDVFRNEQKFKFVVTETHIVEPTELWVMSQATEGEKRLSIQTSYPVGTAKQRFIVVSKLLE